MNPVDRVVPHLYMGSRPPPGTYPFDLIVFAAKEYQPDPRDYGNMILRVPLDDTYGISFAEADIAIRAGRLIADTIKAGKRVLVTCMMGLNRSGLLTALALMRLGASSTQAIAKVRAARGPGALSNPAFEKLLHTLRKNG